MDFVLAIDIGTTRIKHACVSSAGDVVCESAFSLTYATPEEETDIDHWADMLMESITKIPNDLLGKIAAITVSGQGPSLIPIDRHNQIIYPLLFRWQSNLPGNHRGQLRYISLALAYMQKYPTVAQKVRRWVGIPEYIIHYLCGKWVATPPSRQYLRYYWTPAALRRARLPQSQFSPLVYTGAIIAPILASIAKRSAIQPGTPIISGGLDFYTAIIGARCMTRGTICDRAGSTEGINMIGHPARRHPFIQHYPLFSRRVANQSLIILNSGAIAQEANGRALDQVRRMLMHGAATDAAPIIPTLTQRGVARIPAPKIPSGDDASLTRHALQLEALLFTIRYTLEIFPNRRGGKRTVALCGGQTKIDSWNALKSDFLDVDFRRFQCSHTELLGGAAIAFTTLGHYASLREASTHISHLTTVYQPNPHTKQRMADSQRYKQFKDALERSILQKSINV